MSNLNEYVLIIATFISGTFLITQLTRLQNEEATSATSPRADGSPQSHPMKSR
jgi:hypothetical protein